jgi:uncharacterized membrane protein YozB (DUF420 family)
MGMATSAASTHRALPVIRGRLKYLAFTFIGLMMAYVAVHNESFLVNWRDPIWAHYREIKWYLLPHGVTAACALLLGPLQFSDRLRARYANLHRIVGRSYIVGVMIGGPMGAVMQAVEGPVEWTTLAVVDATLWVSTTAIALAFILSGNVTQHRNWMTRSYAVAIVFLEGRVFGGITGIDATNQTLQLAIIWACLAISIPVADVGIHLEEMLRKRPSVRR